MSTPKPGAVKALIYLSCFGTLVMQHLLGAPASDRKELLSELQMRYLNASGKHARNQNPADRIVFTVQLPGIAVTQVLTGTLAPENKIADGHLLQLGTFSQLRVQQGGGRFLTPGESVWMTKIDAKADQIRLSLLTCDGVFSAELIFQFAKEYLGSARPDEVERVIDAALASPGVAPPGPVQTVSAQQSAPQPRGTTPAAISLGDRIDQVIAAFGPPLQIVDLGSKKTYHYKNLKVMFVDGKVADVE